MRITILTLFPSVINEYINPSIIKRGIDNDNSVKEVDNFRDFWENKHKKVNDYQFAGGEGMILSLQPIVDAIKFYKKEISKVILLTPSGKKKPNKKRKLCAAKKGKKAEAKTPKPVDKKPTKKLVEIKPEDIKPEEVKTEVSVESTPIVETTENKSE